MSGSIYKITCIPTGKSYVGQTCDLKYKKGKPYNYGPSGRWNDHVSTARTSTTPLAAAIREHGRDKFKIEVLEQGVLDSLDELEAKWIASQNTLVPNGFNVAKHGRNKHHHTTTLAAYYKGRAVSAELRPIRSNGVYRLVYLSLQLRDGKCQRICFGQNTDCTYEEALADARLFAKQLECPVSEHSSDTFAQKYAKKLEQFDGKVITYVRITTATHLIAVYVATSEMTRYSEQVRICFGGKHVSQDEAYKNAKQFIRLLTITDECKVEDLVQKSSQQATTVWDVARFLCR
jgi:group I intron endonuclease